MFEDFTLERLELGNVTLRVRIGGSGPPVLLLHGHPQTHMMWHRVAPPLATRLTVVAPDLPGYGESSAPPTSPDHGQASKRAVARQMIDLMAHLGFARFAVVGHSRNGGTPRWHGITLFTVRIERTLRSCEVGSR